MCPSSDGIAGHAAGQGYVQGVCSCAFSLPCEPTVSSLAKHFLADVLQWYVLRRSRSMTCCCAWQTSARLWQCGMRPRGCWTPCQPTRRCWPCSRPPLPPRIRPKPLLPCCCPACPALPPSQPSNLPACCTLSRWAPTYPQLCSTERRTSEHCVQDVHKYREFYPVLMQRLVGSAM